MLIGAVLGLLFTGAVTAATFSQLEVDNPSLAARLWPWNGIAFAYLAADEQAKGNSEAGNYARHALQLDPLNPIAARVLAVEAIQRERLRTALNWLSFGESASRREVGTQMVMIELAVTRGNIADALRHYDRALRTSPASYNILFPVLAGAASDAAIRPGIIGLLGNQPYWRSAFLGHLISKGLPDAAMFDVVRGARLQPDQPIERDLLAQAVRKFAEAGAIHQARALLSVPSQQLYNGNFDTPPAFPPVDWQLTDDVDLNVSIDAAPNGRHGNALFFAAHNGSGGIIASQLLALSPGTYRLYYAAGAVPTEIREQPILSVDCLEGQRSLFDHVVARSGDHLRTPDFTVDAACRTQRLSIRTAAELSDLGATASWIDSLRLFRSEHR